MRLVSNFSDVYDWAFDRTGPVLHRMGGNLGPPKREQLALLSKAGFAVPPHGPVGDVMNSWWEAERSWVDVVVAYTDELAHCGEGKKVFTKGHLRSNPHMGMPGGDRYWRENALFCTAFVNPRAFYQQGSEPSVSWRRLQIGPHVVWLEYRSTESWMSNVGDGSCEVVGVDKGVGFVPAIDRPLFAIDFVLGREMYAVDLNFGPGMRGSRVEKVFPAKDVVAAIQLWFDAHPGLEESP